MHPSFGVGNAESTFPPWRDRLNIPPIQYSYALLEKISWAGGNCRSFADAADALSKLADLEIDQRQVERYAINIGQELASYQYRNQEEQSIIADNPTAASVISVDPGKVRTREEDQGPGVHNAQWKNTNVAHLQIMAPQSSDTDPQPNLPLRFQDEAHVRALVAQLGITRNAQTEEKVTLPAVEQDKTAKKKEEVLLKSCLATMASTDVFASNIRNEVARLGMENAKEKVFLADGGCGNWNIHETFFHHWTPILDFIHLIEHLFKAAEAAESKPPQAWSLYLKLASLAWKGKPAEILSILQEYQQKLGVFTSDLAKNDPRRTVHNMIHYIQDNQTRMDYASMRRRGLPISSCRVESLVKQVNQRVKASDKFWINPNVEAVLQIRAAELSTTSRWDNFWEYKMAA